MGSRPTAEGDGVLQVLLWLAQSPENTHWLDTAAAAFTRLSGR